MAIWPLTKMINKRTKKTNHLHFVIILFSQYVFHPVCSYLSKQLLTKEQTKVTTHILQSYHPVSFSKYFIQRSYLSKELLTKEQTKVTTHILQSYHPVSFSKYFIQRSYLSKELLTKEQIQFLFQSTSSSVNIYQNNY